VDRLRLTPRPQFAGHGGHPDTGLDSNVSGRYLYFGFDSQTHAASRLIGREITAQLTRAISKPAQNGITARVSRCPYVLFAQMRVLLSRGVAARIQSWP
jgi:hypothetical protein